MSLTPAPLFTDIYPGPDTGLAHWIETSDGKRLRVAHWTVEGAKGTVLLFPGRTEYVEKYGVIAAEFAKRGLAVMAIDWRGQGLADRMLPDRRIGYVDTFSDYQKDVAAMMRAARIARPVSIILLEEREGWLPRATVTHTALHGVKRTFTYSYTYSTYLRT